MRKRRFQKYEDEWGGNFLPYDDFPKDGEMLRILYKNGQVFCYKGKDKENDKFSHTLHEFYVVGADHKTFLNITFGNQFPAETAGTRAREPYISSAFLRDIYGIDPQLALDLAKSLLKPFTFLDCMKDPDFIRPLAYDELAYDELALSFFQHINLLEFDMSNWKDYVPEDFRMNVVRYVASCCDDWSIKYLYPWTRDESLDVLKVFLDTLTEEETKEFQTFDMYTKFGKALDSDHKGMIQESDQGGENVTLYKT